MPDRELILRRRAAFLSSAMLAVTGCEQTGSSPAPRSPAVEVPSASSTAPTSPPASAPRASHPLFPPMDGRPPAEPPEEAGKYQAEGAAIYPRIQGILERIEQMETDFPRSCVGGCKESLAPLAEGLRKTQEDTGFLRSLCPASSSEGQALERWQHEHQVYLQRRLQRLEQAGRELARRHEGDTGEVTWNDLLQERIRAMVCLSCAQW